MDNKKQLEEQFYNSVSGIVIGKQCKSRGHAHLSVDESSEHPEPRCQCRSSEKYSWVFKRVPDQVPKGWYNVCEYCLYHMGLIEVHPQQKPR